MAYNKLNPRPFFLRLMYVKGKLRSLMRSQWSEVPTEGSPSKDEGVKVRQWAHSSPLSLGDLNGGKCWGKKVKVVGAPGGAPGTDFLLSP